MKHLAVIIASLCMLYSCSTTRAVPEGDQLYTGSKIKWKGDKPKDYGNLEDGMNERLRPKPNRRFLGMPIKLWLYNLGNKPKGKGLNYLLREKWGEAPVLYSKVKEEYTSEILQHYIEDNGYFQAQLHWEKVNESGKKASVRYSVEPGTRYTLRNVVYEMDSSVLGQAILDTKAKSILKPGRIYRLDRIKTERDRINARLKEKGFYYFNADHLLFEIDTNHQGKVDLFLQIKKETPSSARIPYRMENVIIYPGYTLEKDSLVRNSAELDMGTYKVVDPDHLFLPNVFERSVFLKEDSLYTLSAHDITLQRLMNLGTFKFVKGQFTTGLDSNHLNARFFLTPNPQYGLQFELTGSSKSNNTVGSQVKMTTLNRNWLRRANRLEFKLAAGFDWQVGGQKVNQANTNGYTIDAELAISIPKIYIPGITINPRKPYVPRTRISAGYELLSRPGLYNLNSITLQYGYIWRQSPYIDHAFNPISISYVLPSNITPEFQKMLDNDPSLRQSMEKQFIVGGNYTWTFNNQVKNRKNSFFITLNADIAGNILGVLKKKKDDGKKYLFGRDFAQYWRVYGDARYYNRLSRKLIWANRLYLGYGYSYGNSYSLPFVKQFFIGGSNSLRAFRARTLGPGTYKSLLSSYTANEAGDIKLEANTEIRMKLVNILQAAAFVDAGNIWLLRETEGKPGAKFNWGSVLAETAVGGGIGLRADASILIVRFDVAFPFRKPWLPEGERWVFDRINFGDADWRRENLILNIAIGFPF
ncbi:translocation and assembly module lipoprotein TamL [Flavihumibacter petaseus]|uniref:Bacterial surface antigen (D15) domain-containing protein n=1 Tax=Flavihumibacter petaseus NBRC 106054 TaxID=1220578 RepID=A0A0E9N8G5_9BACT|nr:BamA/TamA family outer membrane protein [Flavihumibacter petaseus]GAO45685.1 hypothetical protein FPE01S_08_00050 [Flavihumibacter petaseus NBRC 106054]